MIVINLDQITAIIPFNCKKRGSSPSYQTLVACRVLIIGDFAIYTDLYGRVHRLGCAQ